MHADRHLTVQIAFTNHVRASGMDEPRWLQRLNKAPAQCLIPISSNHLLQHRARLKVWSEKFGIQFTPTSNLIYVTKKYTNHVRVYVMNGTILTFKQLRLKDIKEEYVYIQGNTFQWPKNGASLCWSWKSGEMKSDFIFDSWYVHKYQQCSITKKMNRPRVIMTLRGGTFQFFSVNTGTYSKQLPFWYESHVERTFIMNTFWITD